MKKLFLFVMVVGLVITGSSSVLAYTTFELSATIKESYDDLYSNFSLRYEDKDGDAKFSYDELISFSGVTWVQPTPDNFFPAIIGVPMYLPTDSPYTDGGGTYGYGGQEAWSFFTGSFGDPIINPPPSDWTYTQTVVAPAVPIPAAVWLLGSGLVGLIAIRRKFRKS